MAETEVLALLYYILGGLMFFSFVLLLFLLGCANIAGRGIERILAKKIPLILKGQVKEDHHQHSHKGVCCAEEDHHYDFRCENCWKRVEDAVLRAWIVARAYSLEHIIARSPLAASAATVVTTQIIITIVAGVWNSPRMRMCDAQDRLMLAITMLQCIFILIGWSMIAWRWATAVAYYGSWSSCLWMEDFWTRHLIDLQHAKKTRLPRAELLQAKIESLVANESTKITSPRRLLYAVIWVQLLTVSFSKTCWLCSQILFRNKLTGRLLSFVLLKLKNGCSQYEGILESVQLLGETWESLWLSNRKSIPIAAALISRGKEDGKRECGHLVDFVATNRIDRRPNKPQTVLKYLCKRSLIEGTEEEQFTDMSTKSWKMTAVSLFSIIVQLSPICADIEKQHPSTSGSLPPSVANDCLDAYSRAWEIIDFVDMADTEADEITSEAADQYFFTLQAKVHAANNSREPTARETLAVLRKESKSKEQTAGSNFREKTQGCINWKAAESVTAALADLKKKCKSKTQTPGSVTAASADLEQECKIKTQTPGIVTAALADLRNESKSKTQTRGSVNAHELKSKEKIEGQSERLTPGIVKVFRLKYKEKIEGRIRGWKGNDSIDWSATAWGSAVYKLCNSIDVNEETDVNDLLKELESCLADIINECLEKIQHVLFLNSRKWVVNSDERKNAKALYTAGKARMIMEMLSKKI